METKKIILTDKELDIVRRAANNEFEPNSMNVTREELELHFELIKKASALEEELEAYDEVAQLTSNCNLFAWYLKKYEES